MKPVNAKFCVVCFLLAIVGVNNINNSSGDLSSGNNITRTALTWAPEGKRRPGRLRRIWRRSAERKRERAEGDGMAVIGIRNARDQGG